MIEKIQSPKDLKRLSIDELNILASEIRDALIKKMSIKGGHFGPNLGSIELEIALHYVFDSPRDKFVFDVSHQSYTHKILTGRKDAFFNEKHYDDVSGYTNPLESEHDMFTVGHTSTSISLALGLAKARDIKNDNNNVIAIIGDGSMSGGEALEGLNVAGQLDSNFIIIFNDNQMSIAENHGGMYSKFEQLRNTNGLASDNLFKAFNLDYMYVNNGNDIDSLIEAFQKIKDIDHPIVLHINTEKGHGYAPSLYDKSDWHYTMPFEIETGKQLMPYIRESYSEITGNILKNRIDNGDDVFVVTAALPFNVGFSKDDRLNKYKKNFIDVGIAEETAVAMVSGLAKGHAKPVFATGASFLQRTFDQLQQDLSLDNNAATILVSGASIRGPRDSTHLGIFVSSMLSCISNLKILAPTSKAEYISMLNWSLDQTKESVVILIPTGKIVENDIVPLSDYTSVTYDIDEESDIALIGISDFYFYAKEIKDMLKEKGITVSLVNPRIISSLDTKTLDKFKNYKAVITIEGTSIDGGLGQKIASYMSMYKTKVYNFGLKKEVIDRLSIDEVLKNNHMSKEEIVKLILSL